MSYGNYWPSINSWLPRHYNYLITDEALICYLQLIKGIEMFLTALLLTHFYPETEQKNGVNIHLLWLQMVIYLRCYFDRFQFINEIYLHII